MEPARWWLGTNGKTYDELKLPTCLEMIRNDEELLLICMLLLFLVFGTAQGVSDGRPLVDARGKGWLLVKIRPGAVTISRRQPSFYNSISAL
jgi:hypothetical protein